MKSKFFKRLLAAVVCLMMVVTLLPMGEVAYGNPYDMNYNRTDPDDPGKPFGMSWGEEVNILYKGKQFGYKYKDYSNSSYWYYFEIEVGQRLTIDPRYSIKALNNPYYYTTESKTINVNGKNIYVTSNPNIISEFKINEHWSLNEKFRTLNLTCKSEGYLIIYNRTHAGNWEGFLIKAVNRTEEYKNFSLTANLENVTAAYAVSSNGTLKDSGLKSIANGQTVTEKFNSNSKPGYMVVFVKPNDNYLLTDLGASGANDLYDINKPISESRIKDYPGLQQAIDKAKSQGYVGYFGYSKKANDFNNNSATFTSKGKEVPVNLSAKISKESVSVGDKVDVEVLIEPRRLDGKDVRLDELKVEELKIGSENFAQKATTENVNGAYKKIIKDYVVKEADIASGKISVNVKAEAKFSFILNLNNSGQSIASSTISSAKLNKTVDAKIVQDFVDSTFTINEFDNTANINFKVLSGGNKVISLVDKDKNPLGPVNNGTPTWKWTNPAKDTLINHDLSSVLEKLQNDKYFYYKITTGGKDYFERVEVISNGGTEYQSTVVDANLAVNESTNTYSLSYCEKPGQNIYRISVMDSNKNILRNGFYFTKTNGGLLTLDNFTGFNDQDKAKIKNGGAIYLGIQSSNGGAFTYEKIEITNKNGTNGIVSDEINYATKGTPQYDEREFGFIINGDSADKIAGEGNTSVSFVIKNVDTSKSSTETLTYKNGYKYNLVLKDANAIKEAYPNNTKGANKIQVEVTNENKNRTVLVAAVSVNTRGPVIKDFKDANSDEGKKIIADSKITGVTFKDGDFVGVITDVSADLKTVKVKFGNDEEYIECKVNPDKRTFVLEYDKYKDKDLTNVTNLEINAVDVNNNGSKTIFDWETKVEEIETGLVDPTKNTLKDDSATIVPNVRQFFGVEFKYIKDSKIEISTDADSTQGYDYKIYEVGNRNNPVESGKTVVEGGKIKITPTKLENGKEYIVVVTLSIKPAQTQTKVKFTTDYVTPRGTVQNIKEIKINKGLILQ